MSFSEIEANASDHSEANQKNFNLKPITPEGIFSFACHPGVSCFNRCCHEIDVILTPADILKIKTELNISSDKFLTQYTTMQKLKETGIPLVKLQMRENSNGACIFLDQKKRLHHLPCSTAGLQKLSSWSCFTWSKTVRHSRGRSAYRSTLYHSGRHLHGTPRTKNLDA